MENTSRVGPTIMSKIELFGFNKSTGLKKKYDNKLIMIFPRLDCKKSWKFDLRTSKIIFQNFTNFFSQGVAIFSTFTSEIGNFRLMEATWRCQEGDMEFLGPSPGFSAESSRIRLLASRSGKNLNKVSRTYYKLYRFIRMVCCEAVDTTWWMMTGTDCEIASRINASSSAAGLEAEYGSCWEWKGAWLLISPAKIGWEASPVEATLEAGHGLSLDFEWHPPPRKVINQLCKRLMVFATELCVSTVYACIHVGLCIYVCMHVMYTYTLVCACKICVYICTYVVRMCVYAYECMYLSDSCMHDCTGVLIHLGMDGVGFTLNTPALACS